MNIDISMADPEIQHRIVIYDSDGNRKEGAVQYDTITGWGKRILDPEDPGTLSDYFDKGGYVEVDKVVFDAEHDDIDLYNDLLTAMLPA